MLPIPSLKVKDFFWQKTCWRLLLQIPLSQAELSPSYKFPKNETKLFCGYELLQDREQTLLLCPSFFHVYCLLHPFLKNVQERQSRQIQILDCCLQPSLALLGVFPRCLGWQHRPPSLQNSAEHLRSYILEAF